MSDVDLIALCELAERLAVACDSDQTKLINDGLLRMKLAMFDECEYTAGNYAFGVLNNVARFLEGDCFGN